MGVLIDVFEPWSLEIAKNVGADALKVHSTNVANPYFLEKVAANGQPVLVGTGGTLKNEIRLAIETLGKNGTPHLALIHGFQGYPTAPTDTNLRRVMTLARDFDLPVGFAGHADGGSEDIIFQNILALGMGCSILENHIILNRSEEKTDYHSALEPEKFKRMVQIMRRMQVTLGNDEYELSPAEDNYRKSFKTQCVASRDLSAGHVLTSEDVAFKRSEGGLLPTELSRIIGYSLKCSVKCNQPLAEDLFYPKESER
jgi:sialic acid synthase SpsE